MAYEAKNFDHLLGLKGFSDTLLKNHFTLYAGYVTNTNKSIDALKTLEGSSFAEVKRRFGWEFNGMRLHELYFGNLSKTPHALVAEGHLAKKMHTAFGSIEQWKKEFVAMATMRGIGWVILAYDPVGDMLCNVWVNEHDVGILVGSIPLLVVDVFEHAFMVDYGLKRADYVESCMNAIDWAVVEKRLPR